MAKNLAVLDKLITCLSRLPGIGRRSAERMAMSLIVDGGGVRTNLIGALREVEEKVCCCGRCGCMTVVDENPCRFCEDPARDGTMLCVVENPSDALLIENTGGYKGRYHVLTAKISPMNRQGANDMRLQELIKRLDSEPIEEVVLALDFDVESDATAGFIVSMLDDRPIRISRPATGLPAGSGIAYSDALTLARAMKGRTPLR